MSSNNPLGTTISSDDILETLGFFDDWEDRYKYIIDLGKELPDLDESLKSDVSLVRGCQSQVWIHGRSEGQVMWFDADSDAFIVKGLLAVVLVVYNGKTSEYIQAYDIESYLAQLGLLNHLSVTRGNGLRSMIVRIKALAIKG